MNGFCLSATKTQHYAHTICVLAIYLSIYLDTYIYPLLLSLSTCFGGVNPLGSRHQYISQGFLLIAFILQGSEGFSGMELC